MTTTKFTQIPNHSPATALLVDLLKNGKPGDVLTDEQLQRTSDRDCRTGGNGYQCLMSAIRRVERLHSVVWRRTAGANAIKCLAPSEVVQVAHSARKHVGRVSKRAVHVLHTIDAAALPANERAQASAMAAQLGVLASVATGEMEKKLVARNVVAVPDAQRLLSVFEAGQ